jgi:hypothetical protein
MSTPDPVPHKTGLGHVDLFVAGCALLVSVVSLFIAYQANRTQERMLAASVWPYLSWGTNNIDQNGQDEISFNLYNLGVGPAKIQSLQVLYKGQPMADARALVAACCQQQAAGMKEFKDWDLHTAGINPIVLPGHDSRKFFSLPRKDANAALWQALDRERLNIAIRSCYCSVLDECWVEEPGESQARRVSRCDVPEGQYH